MKQIGASIRRLCAERGISLRVAEWRMGFGRSRLGPIIAGRKRPRGATLLRIATVLGIGALTRDRARIAPMIEGIDPWEWEAMGMAAPSGRPIQLTSDRARIQPRLEPRKESPLFKSGRDSGATGSKDQL